MPPHRNPDERTGLGGKLRSLLGSGLWTLISFALAGLLGFLALVELRSGPLIAAFLGLGAYGFLAYVLPKRARAGQAEPAAMAQGDKLDARGELLVEARQHLATLSKPHTKLPASVRAIVKRLAEEGNSVTDAVTEAPEKLTSVLRFFTYYLPATADLVEDRVKLAPHAGAGRLAEIDQTLGRLLEAFSGFRAALLEPDLASVDVDITLLDDALDADLEDLKTR
jgi:hypothetical protein